MKKDEIRDFFGFMWPLLIVILIGLIFIILISLPFEWQKAKAQARMYEQITGNKVDPVDIFWGGKPPSMDIQVREQK